MENMKMIEAVEIEILRTQEFKDFCLAESQTDTSCSLNDSFLSLTVLLKGYFR
jgi:hypothetical protein